MPDHTDVIEIHGILLRPDNREAWVDGQPVVLTRTEFGLLHFLASHAGHAYSRQEIIAAVQGPDYPATDRSVDSQVTGLRKRLGDRGQLIESIRGVGYRLRGTNP
jgi:two-component system, OmpR family, alkaline phosphatase synthesis response regulator PhoP